ncbi:DNA-binding transcriptional regulator OxyR [Testudinibacter aquarius]|uniref:DNA-binding transcriptional regulator OxyR n=1 Tax=Testudinibacter aquarius TaxID=1524974 RepID=A0A4R3YA39_9PAST|nr:DNA-binding transcriptional regulator OxyR [Testudinibacter aquarius]TNG93044.1 DNA-binding transcriptional regulator OxyR [Pasteurellaceae bacterium USgator41]TNG97349.1 DNA-binding transcriptional regulator OxyR [Pasteurellaceae bacterium UScroc12]TNG97383.1 DNA-binding transcriptional regulator OxyR [Pasteurellaceae bacterium UScroc31]TNG99632.1 DNA-binding transcriptional regulator OxyR [Pasteurellaceae bacterium USgator11]KAE9528366.1 DNA-binding transcriptional regulator OxyR [Testudi
MNIRDLEYLVALSEYKHFRKAADACHVSQPTLSGQIRKLEDELGILLLERTSRKVLFTQSGMLLVEQARKILLEVQIFKEMASNQGKEMSGPLHIGVIPTLGPYLLPCMLPVLEQDFPELELYLYEAQTQSLLEKLEMGQLDCAILVQVPETAGFIEVPMFKEEMMLAVSPKHQWAKERSLPLSVLKDHEILMLDDGHCLREQTMDYCFTAGAHENGHFKATSLETLRNMVAANTGVTLMPKLAIINEGNRQGVEYIPFNDPAPYRSVILVYRPGSPLRARYERIAKMIQAVVTPILT